MDEQPLIQNDENEIENNINIEDNNNNNQRHSNSSSYSNFFRKKLRYEDIP